MGGDAAAGAAWRRLQLSSVVSAPCLRIHCRHKTEAQTRVNLAGEAAKTREKFIDEQERDRQAQGVTRSIAEAATRKQCEGVLLPEFVLPFELGRVRLPT